ncbi:unnamed protein product, partial [Ectocarpus sp. 12 AP-2014]
AKPCTFCGFDHQDNRCPLSPEDRRIAIRKKRGCFLCLEKFYGKHRCARIDACPRCRRHHHSLISCPTNRTDNRPGQATGSCPTIDSTSIE